MEEKKTTRLVVAGMAGLATIISLIQGIEMVAQEKASLGPAILVGTFIVLAGIAVARWGYLHLLDTGIQAFSSEFTQDEKAWSQAKKSLVYVGVTGFSITERFLAWCEKNQKNLPKIIFFLVHPDDATSLLIIASHRMGRKATPEDVKNLQQEVKASMGKLKNCLAAKNGKLEVRFYKVTQDFVPVWMYVVDGKKVYLGFTAPGESGMNSLTYLCAKRKGKYGLFSAYSNLVNRLEYAPPPSAYSQCMALAKKVLDALLSRGLVITTVESCTGGGMAYFLTNHPGSSEVTKGGFVTYSNEQKIALGVPGATIEEYTVYSLETAEAMALAGIKAAVKADIAVGITGSISRVDPTNPNSHPGEVYIAVQYGEKTISRKFIFADEGEREDIKHQAIAEAFRMVLEILN